MKRTNTGEPAPPAKKPEPTADYMGLRQLAVFSSLSVRTLQRWIADPLQPLPHYKVGAKVLVSRRDFEAWIERRRVSRENILARVERAANEIRASMAAGPHPMPKPKARGPQRPVVVAPKPQI